MFNVQTRLKLAKEKKDMEQKATLSGKQMIIDTLIFRKLNLNEWKKTVGIELTNIKILKAFCN